MSCFQDTLSRKLQKIFFFQGYRRQPCGSKVQETFKNCWGFRFRWCFQEKFKIVSRSILNISGGFQTHFQDNNSRWNFKECLKHFASKCLHYKACDLLLHNADGMHEIMGIYMFTFVRYNYIINYSVRFLFWCRWVFASILFA